MADWSEQGIQYLSRAGDAVPGALSRRTHRESKFREADQMGGGEVPSGEDGKGQVSGTEFRLYACGTPKACQKHHSVRHPGQPLLGPPARPHTAPPVLTPAADALVLTVRLARGSAGCAAGRDPYPGAVRVAAEFEVEESILGAGGDRDAEWARAGAGGEGER
jgi:hypothetical protein